MKLLFISLGCDKNLVDSEEMLGRIRERGYEITDDEMQAEVIIVNTCCFIHDAKEESIQTILEMAELKKTACLRVLIAAGCLAERYKEEVLREIPEVDGIIGTTGYEDIVRVIDQTLKGEKASSFRDINYLPSSGHRHGAAAGGYTSYLKIAEGCDKKCTYCIIPRIRGNYRSVPMEELARTAEELAQNGVVELCIVAQETTLYGMDLYGRKMLPELLSRLCRIDELKWIRLLYCYPEEITDALIEVMAEEEKICRYLDIPVQHASDRILKRMGRKTDKAHLISIIRTLREKVPGIALRTTLITGFPGETEEDHRELLDFVREMEFDRLGVFPYSPEEDTPAAEMADQIPESVKQGRRDEIMVVQQEIAFAAAQKKIANTVTVLIEGKLPDEDVYIGRTEADAPKVDGFLFLSCPYELISGEFVEAMVTDAEEYDLIGVLSGGLNEFTK